MRLYNLILLMLVFVGSTSCKDDDPVERTVEEFGVNYADPFIMLYNDTYYAYGTKRDNGIEVSTSTDLVVWKRAEALALHKSDSWGDKWYWAPEVYYIKEKNKFYMYYSADEHICVATSDSPTGPFVQEVKEPLIPGEQTIDNTLFIDDDGTPYTYFDRFNDGLNIWVAQLDEDYITIKTETMAKCINVSQSWEQADARVNEGAFVMKYKDIYYLTYSGNAYTSPWYGIGYATSTSPIGPWTKYAGNPIFQKPAYKEGVLEGVGHSAMFKDKEGKLRIVFHAHYAPGTIDPRQMYIADVTFSDDTVPVMSITGDIIHAIIY